MSDHKLKDKKRVIGRWFICETLGKGGYSFVKKGRDVKTNKTVALKFMEKADSSWIKEQASQVETEIDALKNIRHKNVMKLYAYNLNAQYPTKIANKFVETILLVLEYAPGGELFDILYYTSKLEPVIARTYFRQMIYGLEACHNAQVVHRDLKPQNLLLDAKYNLKITDFGLSKVIESDEDALMKTSYVGTRGYQAPELLLKNKYDMKCDVFSAGVIFFILLCGYPPFEQARADDKWFKPLIKNNTEKFWKAHHSSQAAKDPSAKDLLEKMLAFNPNKRISVAQIKEHAWFNGPVLKQDELVRQLRVKHRKAEELRKQDVAKISDLQNSIGPVREIPGLDKAVCDMFPSDRIESVHCVYSYGGDDEWKVIYSAVEKKVVSIFGDAKLDLEANNLHVKMKVKNKGDIEFTVKVYRSLEFHAKKPDNCGDEKDDVVYCIEMRREKGDFWTYNQIRNTHFLKGCANYFKGLPKWAKKIKDKEEHVNVDEEKGGDNDDEEEYFNLCKKEPVV